MKPISEKKIALRAKQLNYVGDHALRTSGNHDEDELEMVQDEMALKKCSLDDAIHEVVRTRKHREGAS